jgi:S1-C subfamily serine protease
LIDNQGRDAVIESVLLAVTPVRTFREDQLRSNATGFFYERGERVFLITAGHVFLDEASGHRPDRIEIQLHIDPADATKVEPVSIPLYRDGEQAWTQAADAGGNVDVAAIEAGPALPGPRRPQSFNPGHLLQDLDEIEIGDPVLIVGFPLGFEDTLHHLPVARQASVASAFGLRFQGQGYFLTDARMHRGTSGAPVVVRSSGAGREALPWTLLGIHSMQMDLSNRDVAADGRLGLNCAWYADVLAVLTAPH